MKIEFSFSQREVDYVTKLIVNEGDTNKYLIFLFTCIASCCVFFMIISLIVIISCAKNVYESHPDFIFFLEVFLILQRFQFKLIT